MKKALIILLVVGAIMISFYSYLKISKEDSGKDINKIINFLPNPEEISKVEVKWTTPDGKVYVYNEQDEEIISGFVLSIANMKFEEIPYELTYGTIAYKITLITESQALYIFTYDGNSKISRSRDEYSALISFPNEQYSKDFFEVIDNARATK